MLHPLGLEAMGGAGADWILLDCEHGPGDPNEVLVALQAMQAGTATAIARPAWNDSVLIKRYLDLGVNTLLIGFELLVASLQAYVFAVLTCIYLHDAVHLH